jgi:transcription initiation factor TFIID subunit 9B
VRNRESKATEPFRGSRVEAAAVLPHSRSNGATTNLDRLCNFLPSAAMSRTSTESLPPAARAIALLLASTPTVQDAQPGVLHQLLEFSHRYTAQVLSDALVYAEHAGRPNKLEMDDVTLAVQARVGWEFGGRVPKEVGFLSMCYLSRHFGISNGFQFLASRSTFSPWPRRPTHSPSRPCSKSSASVYHLKANA